MQVQSLPVPGRVLTVSSREPGKHNCIVYGYVLLVLGCTIAGQTSSTSVCFKFGSREFVIRAAQIFAVNVSSTPTSVIPMRGSRRDNLRSPFSAS